MNLSRNGKIFPFLLVVFVFCDVPLSALGFEARGSAILGNPASFPLLGLLFGGLILNIASLVLVFRARVGPVLATIGSIGYIILAFADQSGL